MASGLPHGRRERVEGQAYSRRSDQADRRADGQTGAHRTHEDAPAIKVRICPVDVDDHSGSDPASV